MKNKVKIKNILLNICGGLFLFNSVLYLSNILSPDKISVVSQSFMLGISCFYVRYLLNNNNNNKSEENK